jgi:hypothetical protein
MKSKKSTDYPYLVPRSPRDEPIVTTTNRLIELNEKLN